MAQTAVYLFNADGSEKPMESVLAEASRATYQDTIVIHGKEPTSHTMFRDILLGIAESKPKEIALITNGHAFRNKGEISFLANASALNIFVTPFETELFVNKETAAFNAAYASSLQGIATLLACNLRVAAMIPILPENNQHLLDMLIGIDAIGLKNIVLEFPPPKPSAMIPRYSDLHQGVLNALDAVNYIVHVEGLPPCMLGQESEHASRYFTLHDSLKRQFSGCLECSLHNECPGIYEKYLQAHGDGELAPLDENREPRKPKDWPGQSAAAAITSNTSFKINQESDKSCLKISADEIMQVLKVIEFYPNIWDLIENLGYPIPVMIKIIDQLKDNRAIEVSGENIKIVNRINSPQTHFKPFDDQRLPSDPQYCQLRVRSKELAERARYIIDSCAAGGSIAVLGDDDFFSLMLAESRHFSEVALFEIDKKVSARIAEIAGQEKLPLVVAQHDLRKPLPARFLRQYDAFYTDSPYSLKGFELFVSRGLQLLKKGSKKHGFASFSCEIPIMEEVELPVQKAITEMGLFIERKTLPAANVIPPEFKKRFPTYKSLRSALDNASLLTEQERWYLACLGRKETLFHMLTTEQTKPIIIGECNEEIYYGEDPLEFYLRHMKKNP